MPVTINTQIGAVKKSDGTYEGFDGFSSDISEKLTQPSTFEVGKYFRVASIDDNGHPVLEAVDLPIATNSTVGLVYARQTSDGLALNENGMLYIAKCTDSHIANKSDTARPICPNQIDKAVRAGLIANSQITDSDKADICRTIGAEQAKGDWVLKATMNSADPITVDFTGCTELFIDAKTVGTGNTPFFANGDSFLNYIVVDGNRHSVAMFVDSCNGFIPINSRYSSSLSSTALIGQIDAAVSTKYKIADINRFSFNNTSLVSSCDIRIYAR